MRIASPILTQSYHWSYLPFPYLESLARIAPDGWHIVITFMRSGIPSDRTPPINPVLVRPYAILLKLVGQKLTHLVDEIGRGLFHRSPSEVCRSRRELLRLRISGASHGYAGLCLTISFILGHRDVFLV